MEKITNWPQAVAYSAYAFSVATVLCVIAGTFFTGRWPWHKD